MNHKGTKKKNKAHEVILVDFVKKLCVLSVKKKFLKHKDAKERNKVHKGFKKKSVTKIYNGQPSVLREKLRVLRVKNFKPQRHKGNTQGSQSFYKWYNYNLNK